MKGTYLHGAVESAELITELFGFTPQVQLKDRHYNGLADWLEFNSSSAVLSELIGD